MSSPKRGKRTRTVKAVTRRPALPRADRHAVVLLTAVAGALNACETAGISVKLAHGAVITEHGYVFAVGPDGTPWAVRTRMLTEFPLTPGDD